MAGGAAAVAFVAFVVLPLLFCDAAVVTFVAVLVVTHRTSVMLSLPGNHSFQK